jgi:hypothetical protein
MVPVELRPLSLGELLDRTFTLYRAHFWLFAGIMAIPAAFSVPLNVFIFSSQRAALSSLPPGTPASPPSAWIIAVIILFAVVLLFVYAFAIGAATFAVSESYLGQHASVRDSYGKVMGKCWKIIGVTVNVLVRFYGLMLLAFIGVAILTVGAATLVKVVFPAGAGNSVVGAVVAFVIFLAILAALLFTFVLALRYAVSIPALLLEGLGVFAAIRRSVRLTQGRRWHIFLACLLTTVVAYVGVIIFQGPFFAAIIFSARGGGIPAWLSFGAAAGAAIGGTITGPLLMIVIVLCYYDSRIRKEAFDLELMMSSLDQPASAPPGTAAAS